MSDIPHIQVQTVPNTTHSEPLPPMASNIRDLASFPTTVMLPIQPLLSTDNAIKEASLGSTSASTNLGILKPLSNPFTQGTLASNDQQTLLCLFISIQIQLMGPLPQQPTTNKAVAKEVKKQGRKAVEITIDPNTANAKYVFLSYYPLHSSFALYRELFGIKWLASLGPNIPRSMAALNAAWKKLRKEGKKVRHILSSSM